MSGTQIRLDTHVVVWLHGLALDRLSATARDLIDARQIVISPVVELELTFLHEIERITTAPTLVLDALAQRIGLTLSEVPFASAVTAAAEMPWTRDPFDRLIAGDASAAACQLLTRDRTILKHFPLAVW